MAPGSTCGEALVRLLERAGFDTVFGIPGVHTLELYRGLASSPLRHVLARHEQGAGFMADGYARASGRPALCFVITGPGVTNIATPMGQAWSDSVPMLVISSANARPDLGMGRGRLHESSDQLALTAPLTCRAALARQPADIPAFIDGALQAFRTGRPRPAQLHIPIDLLAEQTDADWLPGELPQPEEPDPKAVEATRVLLRSARRPAIVAGGGAAKFAPAVTRLAEGLSAVVATTTAGKGVVPESHPLSLGATLSQSLTQKLLESSDVVLALGTELAETDLWTDGPLRFGGKLVRVDVDPGKLADEHVPDVAVQSDIGAFLARLGEVRSAASEEEARDRAATARERIAMAWGGLARRHFAVLQVIRRALPQDGFVATDMTQLAYTGNSAFPVDHPRSWFHPSGFGTLGYAVPAAIGAKLAVPDRPGMALAGDFGFQFTMQELGTAVELGLSLPIVLWNNGGLGQIRGDMVAQGIPEIGVTAKNPDFMGLAEAYGCAGVRPGDLVELEHDLRAAFDAGRPTLIEVRDTIVADNV